MRTRTKSWTRTCGLVAAIALTAAVSAQTENVPTAEQSAYEQWYLQSMIDHHAQAIQLASLAPSRSTNPIILNAAADVVANRSAEIQSMQSWLRQWYGVDYYPDPLATNETLWSSQLAGPGFDRAFMISLGRHNQQSILAARQAEPYVYHWDLVQASRDIAWRQANENNQLTLWLSSPMGTVRRGSQTFYLG